MSIWGWIAIGLLDWLALSVVIGLLLAALMRRLGSDVPARPGGESPRPLLLRRVRSRSF